MTTDDLWLKRMSHPGWAHVGALFGAFLAAVGMGWLLANAVRPGAELFGGFSCFLFLFILMGGYSAWIGRATSLLSGHLFRGFWKAFSRFLWRRQEGDLRTAGEALRSNLEDKEKWRELVGRIRRGTIVFLLAGIMAGLGFGLVAGLFATHVNLFLAWGAYVLGATVYGFVLWRLARAGYLPLPAEM